uniref:hypothetical protein n=1 Tax=Nostoc sp. CCY0012 TaxID=1056123 RepID=UPI0039C6F642
MALPSTSVGGAFLSRQAARLSFESGLRLAKLKKLPGLANGLTSALQRNAYFDGKVAKPLGELGKVQDKILEKTPGSGNLGKASNLSGSLGAFVAIGGVAVIVALQAKVSEFVQAQEDKNFDRLSADLTKVNELAVRANLANQQQELKFQQFSVENANIDQKINILNNSTQDARKLANDALYEARQGRTIVEAKVETARKQANDALYETRQGRTILENQIAQQQRAITAQLAATELRIQSALRANDSALVTQLQGRVNSLQGELNGLKSTVNNFKIPSQTIDITAISNNVRSSLTPLINASNAIAVDAKFIAVNAGNKVDAVSNRITGLEISNGILGDTIVGLAQNISTVDSKANNALREAQIKGVPTGDLQRSLDDKFNAFVQQNNQALGIRDLQQSNLSKEFDKKLADFVNQSNLTADQRFNQFRQENNNRLGVQDLKLSNLSNDFDKKFGEFVNLSNKTSEERFTAFTNSNQQKLGLLTKEVEKIDTRIKEQEKVNQEAIPKLDQLIFTAGLIPGRTADVIRPSIPTPQQINQAVQTGNCQSLNGGCSGKAMQDLANNINSNTQNANNDLLNKLNAGANASQLALLNTINTKLGGQIVGGISGKLVDGFKWLHLDRVLNVLTFAATVHNAVQLSNDIGQT